MLLPVNHASNPPAAEIYKAEPCVAVAEIDAVPPQVGRGGWTWYTGSAGWRYRLILERLLGLKLEVYRLRFAPVCPTPVNAMSERRTKVAYLGCVARSKT